MFPKAAPTGPSRPNLPATVPVLNWSVALYRKVGPSHSANVNDHSPLTVGQHAFGSFFIQLQHQACSSSPSSSDVLYVRYQGQEQRNSIDAYQLPFTISQLSEMKMSPDQAPLASTRFNTADVQASKRVTTTATNGLRCLSSRFSYST
jgi:hypothetical protein